MAAWLLAHKWATVLLAVVALVLIALWLVRRGKFRDLRGHAKEIVEASVLIALGLAGVFHEVLHFIGVDIQHPESFTLRIVGLLAIALGLERFTQFGAVEKKIESLHEAVTKRLPVEVISGYDNVYDRAATLLRTSHGQARAVVYANFLPAPERFVEAIIDMLKKQPHARYDITFVTHVSELTDEFWNKIDARRDRLQQEAVLDRFEMNFIEAVLPVGFDVLVIDQKHCCFAFSPATSEKAKARRELSIHIEMEPELAKHMHSWLNNLPTVSEDLVRKKWIERQKKKQLSRAVTLE